jgi:hypothetical protein
MDEFKRRCAMYSNSFQARAVWLAEISYEWIPFDMVRYPAETGEYDQEVRRRQTLLWKVAVDNGAMLLHVAVQRALSRFPRVQTRILQLRAELSAAVNRGELPYNHRGGIREGIPSQSCDHFLALMFEDTCRLWPPPKKSWWPKYGAEAETAALFAKIMGEIGAELAMTSEGRPQ